MEKSDQLQLLMALDPTMESPVFGQYLVDISSTPPHAPTNSSRRDDTSAYDQPSRNAQYEYDCTKQNISRQRHHTSKRTQVSVSVRTECHVISATATACTLLHFASLVFSNAPFPKKENFCHHAAEAFPFAVITDLQIK